MTLPDDIELREELESRLCINGCQQRTAGYNEAKKGKKGLDTDDMERMETIAVNEAMKLIATYRKKWETDAADKVAKNALVIADYWINEDGRSKHLLQDLQDVKDISVLDHIDQKYIDRYKEKTSD